MRTASARWYDPLLDLAPWAAGAAVVVLAGAGLALVAQRRRRDAFDRQLLAELAADDPEPSQTEAMASHHRRDSDAGSSLAVDIDLDGPETLPPPRTGRDSRG